MRFHLYLALTILLLSGCGNDGTVTTPPEDPIDDKTLLTSANAADLTYRALNFDPVSYTGNLVNIANSGAAYCTLSGGMSVTTADGNHTLTFSACQSDATYIDGTLVYTDLNWSGYDEARYYDANLTIQSTGWLEYNLSVLGTFYLASNVDGDWNVTDMNLEHTYATGSKTTTSHLRDVYLTGLGDSSQHFGGEYAAEEINATATTKVSYTMAVVLTTMAYYDNYPKTGSVTLTGKTTQQLTTVFDGGYTGGTDVTVHLGSLPLFSGTYYDFNLWLVP